MVVTQNAGSYMLMNSTIKERRRADMILCFQSYMAKFSELYEVAGAFNEFTKTAKDLSEKLNEGESQMKITNEMIEMIGVCQESVKLVNEFNGWTNDGISMSEHVDLIATECRELVLGAIGLESPKPFMGYLEEELADIFIRSLDAANRNEFVAKHEIESADEDLVEEFHREIDLAKGYGDALAGSSMASSALSAACILFSTCAEYTERIRNHEVHFDALKAIVTKLIYQVLIVSEELGIDIIQSVTKKLLYNIRRGFRHGGKAM